MYLYKMYAVVCTTTRVCYPRALSLSLSKCAKNITRVFECRPFVASRRTFRFFFFSIFYVQMTLFGALTLLRTEPLEGSF